MVGKLNQPGFDMIVQIKRKNSLIYLFACTSTGDLCGELGNCNRSWLFSTLWGTPDSLDLRRFLIKESSLQVSRHLKGILAFEHEVYRYLG